jgi:leucyl/phenylalanyl-tRNA--protein transferase
MTSPSIIPAIPDTAARRAELFRETPRDLAERIMLGLAWSMKPKRIGALPGLARVWLRDAFRRGGLPDPAAASESGIAGIAHDLSPETLLAAYSRTLYPWAHVGPAKWLSTHERCVLDFKAFHIGKNTRRLLRQDRYRVTFDRDFEGVIKACAERRPGKWHVTWITPRIMRAYADLFDAGHVHSFEVWNADNALVGGGYGLALGDVFFTESQFSRERDTSKLGFTVLNAHLARAGFALNDGKSPAPALLDMGFHMIARAELQAVLDRGTQTRRPGRWTCEMDLKSVAEWKPEAEAARAL